MEINQFENRSYQDDLATILNDKKRFLGEYNMDKYKLSRSYLNGDGKQLRLLYTQFIPKENATASICIIHGIADHTGPFMSVAESLCLKGYWVHLIDMRGFGYSGGARGCSTLHQLLLDVGSLLHQVNTGLPLFLYGHCLGALTCLLFSLLNPHLKLAGIICTSPLLAFPSDGRFTWLRLNFLKNAGKVLEDLVINSLINPTALTKRTQYMKEITGDRLATPFLGLNMASSLIQGAAYMKANASQFRVPILLIHGKEDTVVSYHEAIQFYDRCSSAEKTLKLFDKGMHELQHDEECTEMQRIIVDWISRRVGRAQPVGCLPAEFNVRYVQKSKLIGRKRLAVIILFIVLWHLGIIYKLRKTNFKQSLLALKDRVSQLVDKFIE